ncbi:MFS transporter [Pseudonocardia nematodicida]|uniref:MFS transporter n=1 Tax=Pseudonocardia nematodicida TaxID=1206997 RepID=A0ABV1KHC9_9PSEU
MSTAPIDAVVGRAPLNAFHAWVVVIAALLMVIDGYDLVSFGSALPHIIADWDADPVLMGLVASSALLGVFVGGLVVAPLADRHGRRPVIAATILAASVASFLCGFVHDPYTLAALRFVVGLAIGGLMPNFMALTAEVSPLRYKSVFVALVSAFYAIGGLIAAFVGILLEPVFGWRVIFFVAGAGVLMVPVVLRLLPESPEYLLVVGDRERLRAVVGRIVPGFAPGDIDAISVPIRSPRSPVARILSRRNALATVLIWVFFVMTMVLSYALLTWLPVLMRGAGFALSSAIWTLVVLNLGGFVGSVLGGWLAVRFTFRRTLVGYFTAAVTAFVGLSFNPPAAVLYAWLFVAGAAVIGILAIIHAFAVEFYPASVRSTGVGWATGVGRIGAIAGPIIGGMLVAAQLPLQVSFLVFVVPAAIGCLAVILVARRSFVGDGTDASPRVTTR